MCVFVCVCLCVCVCEREWVCECVSEWMNKYIYFQKIIISNVIIHLFIFNSDYEVMLHFFIIIIIVKEGQITQN